eukprot:Gb_04448 [translate_table: standard]
MSFQMPPRLNSSRVGMRWGCMEYSIALVGLVTIGITMLVTMDSDRIENILNLWQVPMDDMPPLVDLTLVEAAASKGAVCLDGTLPGYHLHQGFGSGSNSWLIHIEGGGWCNNVTTCSMRKRTHLGSSLYMERQVAFLGILSNKPSQNPDFFNWNRVKVRYCDGASFIGDVDVENEAHKVFFRGQRIWQAIMEDLLAKGMDKADQGLLSGCSAGGLASGLHCDNFRELLPKHARVKCLVDAGFFIDAKDISGSERIRSFYSEVVTVQGVAKNLPKGCTSHMDATKCFYLQYLLPYIQTPLFILNAAYDSWQIQNILAPVAVDPYGHWKKCKLNIRNCSPNQLATLQEFRIHMLNELKIFKSSKVGGMFINSCYTHCQSEMQVTWFSPESPRLNNKTIAEAVGDWYFGRSVRQDVDCPYPCNPTCHHLIFKPWIK